jgi:leader peptidase (prepilin peptidase)/N-methyltransferase
VLFLAFLAGLGVGVVLNSLADYLPPDELGQRRAPGRPRCRYCGAAYSPGNWLAVLSFLARRGRCEHCAAPRPLRHVAVELATGASLAYVWRWAAGDWAAFLASAVIVAIFILVTVVDLEHRLILGVVIYPSALLIGLINSLQPERGPVKTLLGGLAGYGLVLGLFMLAQVFALVAARLRGRPLEEVVFGWGDVNLAGVVGLAVGWSGVLFAVVLAIFLGGLFSAAYIVVQVLRRRYDPYTAIPYGPFLILGGLAIYFYGQEFALWYAGR